MLFRLIGYLCAGAIGVGVVELCLNLARVSVPSLSPQAALTLMIGGFLVSGWAAMIDVFLVTRRPRREQWIEYYRQCLLPFRAIEQLIGHGRGSGRPE